jgi:hypothetical protein
MIRKRPTHLDQSKSGEIPPRVASGKPNSVEVVFRPGAKQRIGMFASNKEPRCGEDGVLDVCKRLVKHLDEKEGIRWSDPRLVSSREEGIDCLCDSLKGLLSSR